MKLTNRHSAPASRSTGFRGGIRFQIISGLLGLWLAGLVTPARADTAEDIYLRIYSIIDRADTLRDNHQTNQAVVTYQQAYTNLFRFKQEYPKWNPTAVAFRLNYVTEKIKALAAPPEAEAGTASPAGEAQAAERSGGPVQIKLLGPGAEPRTKLRLGPRPDATQTVGMTAKSSVIVTMAGNAMPSMKVPPMIFTLSCKTESVMPNGDINYELHFDDAAVGEDSDANPAIAEMVKASLAGLKGLTAKCTLTDRGLAKKADIAIPAGADERVKASIEQMKDSISQVQVPLPEDAVGVGASWEVKQKTKSQGMAVEVTTTYTLAAVENEVFTIKSSTVKTAAKQKIASPVMPQMKADLSKLTSSGSSTTKIELAKLMPTEGTAEEHSEAEMSMTVGNAKQNITIKSESAMQLQPK